jgi:glyoxylase-like metal-dependent hydrolase (beta-lactamase superfamily II)
MGQVAISAVEGNRQKLDGGSMFGNAPKPVWERWCPPDDQGRIDLACRAMLVEFDEEKILCETGIGAFFEPKLASRYGVVESEHMLLKSLQSLGLRHEDITAVVLSHLHFDHAGGLLQAYDGSGKNTLLFPNAKYIVGKRAFDRAVHPHFRDRASFIPGMDKLLRDSGRLILIDSEKDLPANLAERLRFYVTDGHTPGQMHTIVKGDHSEAIFAGDLIPGRAWVHLPITMGYDRYPEKVIDEKLHLYETVTHPNLFFFYTHDAECAMSKIVKEQGGKFVTKDLVAKPVRYAL